MRMRCAAVGKSRQRLSAESALTRTARAAATETHLHHLRGRREAHHPTPFDAHASSDSEAGAEGDGPASWQPLVVQVAAALAPLARACSAAAEAARVTHEDT